MLSYEAHSSAPPQDVWRLMARPDRWHEWAPHLRGAWGLGSPEVRPGAVGAVRLLGIAPLPARILNKAPGRSWAWRVGPLVLDHRVEPDGDGSRVVIDIQARGKLEAALRLTYGPLVGRLTRNLARVAEQGAGR